MFSDAPSWEAAWRFVNPRMNPGWTISLGATAENVARRYGISREAQDSFAAESQRRAACAIAAGVFNDEIVDGEIRDRPAFCVDDGRHHVDRQDVALELSGQCCAQKQNRERGGQSRPAGPRRAKARPHG